MLTRIMACNALGRLIGKNVGELAKKFDVPVVGKSGKIDKGWKGQALQAAIGIPRNNEQAPNGLGYELKTVSYIAKGGLWRPNDTMSITQIDADCLKAQAFYDSHVWEKMKSLLLCIVSYDGKNATTGTLLEVTTFDFLKDGQFLTDIEADYNYIRNKLITQGWGALTGKDGKYMQARTKGPGHGSTSRAFYLRKTALEILCQPFPTFDYRIRRQSYEWHRAFDTSGLDRLEAMTFKNAS